MAPPDDAPKAGATSKGSGPIEDKPITITLRKPITYGGTTWTKLEFVPLVGRHLRELPGDTARLTIGHLIDIAERMTGAPTGVMDELGPEDTAEVLDVVNAFLARIQGTGPAQSAD